MKACVGKPMQPVPMNVYLQVPTDPPPDWPRQAQQWINLNTTPATIRGYTGHGHPDFYPLTVKAGYVVGLIYDVCGAVTALLHDKRTRREHFLIAYGVFASAIDLLGRCIQGNSTYRANANGQPLDVKMGFRWLKRLDMNYINVNDNDILVSTPQGQYSIDMLVAMRHYAAHGQATTNKNSYVFNEIDYDVLELMPLLLAEALEVYWNMLQARDHFTTQDATILCNHLAHANIAAFRHAPIHNIWILIQQHGSLTNVFKIFNWTMTGYRI
jgi:hypothetical protein